MGYWPVFFALAGAVALMTWKHRSRLLVAYFLVIAILGGAARGVYIFLCHAPNSSRYFLPQYWLLFLCGSVGMVWLCRIFRNRTARICLAVFWVLVVGASFSAKIVLHGLNSSQKKLTHTRIGELVEREIAGARATSAGFVCDKFDMRIALPSGVALYSLNQSPQSGWDSMVRQAALNHDLLFVMITRSPRQNDIRELILAALREFGPCEVRELGKSRKPNSYGSLYCVRIRSPRPNLDELPLLDSQKFFRTFAKLRFPEAKVRRIVELRMSPGQYDQFLLPERWSVDETYCWSPQCFPASSAVVSGADGEFWNISSRQKISIVCSESLPSDSPQWLLVVDLESGSADARFQPAVVSGGGYAANIRFAPGKRRKYYFLLDLPAKPAAARLGLLTEGIVRIFDLKLYRYDDRQKANFHKEPTVSGN